MFDKSQEINELTAALVKVQAQLKGAKYDATNPYFQSRYATLASVWDACREPLSGNGLAVVQFCRTTDTAATLCTLLTHESGQWICGEEPLPKDWNEPQKMGSAITYARRYGLSAMVGICPEDDDAEAATTRTVRPAPVIARPPAAPVMAEPKSGEVLGDDGAAKLVRRFAETKTTMKDLKIFIGSKGGGEIIMGRDDPGSWPAEVGVYLGEFFSGPVPSPEAALLSLIRDRWAAETSNNPKSGTPDGMLMKIMEGKEWKEKYPDPDERARVAIQDIQSGNVTFPDGEVIPF